MKKIFLFAALAGIVFASCQKEASVAAVQNEGQQEIALNAFQGALTKGVFGSGTFDTDTPIYVAGALVTGPKEHSDFLPETKFVHSDGAWKAIPPVYYPLGGENSDFRFIAYSVAGTTESYIRWYGSTEVEFQVAEDCATNDIVYSGFIGNKSAAASAIFKHALALVTVNIKTSASGQQIKINSIGFEDVKTTGTLNLKIHPEWNASNAPTGDDAPYTSTDYYKAVHTWIYSAGCTCKCAQMLNTYLTYDAPASADDDPYVLAAEGLYDFDTYDGSAVNKGFGDINNVGCNFDRLFPAQKLETKTMVINYTLGDLTADAKVDLSTATLDPSGSNPITWAAGKHYVYVITVNPIEITINPTSPDAWTLQTITPGGLN